MILLTPAPVELIFKLQIIRNERKHYNEQNNTIYNATVRDVFQYLKQA